MSMNRLPLDERCPELYRDEGLRAQAWRPFGVETLLNSLGYTCSCQKGADRSEGRGRAGRSARETVDLVISRLTRRVLAVRCKF